MDCLCDAPDAEVSIFASGVRRYQPGGIPEPVTVMFDSDTVGGLQIGVDPNYAPPKSITVTAMGDVAGGNIKATDTISVYANSDVTSLGAQTTKPSSTLDVAAGDTVSGSFRSANNLDVIAGDAATGQFLAGQTATNGKANVTVYGNLAGQVSASGDVDVVALSVGGAVIHSDSNSRVLAELGELGSTLEDARRNASGVW